jgi:quinol monooxygenase YgiN
MIGVVVTINIKPGFKEPFMQSMLEDAAGSMNHEPGCLRFDVLQDSQVPHRIYLMEVYRDEAAFETHTQQPHFTK